jgi:hypothetical protein
VIDAYRRGIISGAQEVRKAKEPLTDAEAHAKRTFATMRDAAYAHIEPESEFVRGFIESVRLAYCLSRSA